MRPMLHKATSIVTGLLFMLAFNISIASAQDGDLVGQVIDGETGEPLGGATVFIDELGTGATADLEGGFVLEDISAGTYTLTISFVGYDELERQVEIQAGEVTEIEVELMPEALGLDEVIVTGQAGDTRRREMGSSIASIGAEDFEGAAIQSASQMLQGRAAGMTVEAGGGKVGQAHRINLRGVSSITQGNQPVIYIDGVRMDNSQASGVWTGGQSWTGLDDINPNDIERIEVIRGASAATLYGTEASAGIIQIFTRGGQATDQHHSTVRYQGQYGVSHTARDQWDISAYSDWFYDEFIGTGTQQEHNLSAQGQLTDVNYFVSGTFRESGGVMPNNREDFGNLRGNVHAFITDDLNVRFNAAYSQRLVKFPQDANNIYGYAINGLVAGENGLFTPPHDIGHIDVGMRSRRTQTGVSVNYNPSDNLSSELNVGVDLVNTDNTEFFPYGAITHVPLGRAVNYRREARNYNFEWRNTYSTSFGPFDSRTALGMQSYWERIGANQAQGEEFPAAGLSTVGALATTTGWETRIETQEAGIFTQQRLAYEDFVFLTLGLRADGHSAFGEDYPYELYPQVGLSYLISEQVSMPDMINTLRLRAAYGQAGQQPGAFDAVRTWSPVAAVDGEPAITTGNVGDPELAPEVSHEYEAGLETSMLGDRVTLDLNYYYQKTEDALINVQDPPSRGFTARQLRNVGETVNYGIEGSIDATLVNFPDLMWSVNANVTTNHSEILDLGIEESIQAQWTQYHREGFPIAAFHDDRYIEHEGEIGLASELIGDQDDWEYIGPAFPTRNIQLGSDLRWNQFRFDFLIDHAGGHYVESTSMRWMAQQRAGEDDPVLGDELAGERVATFCQEPEDAVMERYCEEPWGEGGPRGNNVQPADYIRLREVTLSYAMPGSFLDTVGLSSATLYLSGRNLLTWLESDVLMEAEANYNSGSDLAAQDYFDTPLPRMVLGGLQIEL